MTTKNARRGQIRQRPSIILFTWIYLTNFLIIQPSTFPPFTLIGWLSGAKGAIEGLEAWQCLESFHGKPRFHAPLTPLSAIESMKGRDASLNFDGSSQERECGTYLRLSVLLNGRLGSGNGLPSGQRDPQLTAQTYKGHHL